VTAESAARGDFETQKKLMNIAFLSSKSNLLRQNWNTNEINNTIRSN